MCRLLGLKDDTMIVLVSQTKWPDSSKPDSDIVGAVHCLFTMFWILTHVNDAIKPLNKVAQLE